MLLSVNPAVIPSCNNLSQGLILEIISRISVLIIKQERFLVQTTEKQPLKNYKLCSKKKTVAIPVKPISS